jgi:hypothetical protein
MTEDGTIGAGENVGENTKEISQVKSEEKVARTVQTKETMQVYGGFAGCKQSQAKHP